MHVLEADIPMQRGLVMCRKHMSGPGRLPYVEAVLRTYGKRDLLRLYYGSIKALFKALFPGIDRVSRMFKNALIEP